MIIEPKIWDSNFYQLRIGVATIEYQDDSLKLAALADNLRTEYDLLYVFDPHCYGFECIGAKLMDEKVLYSKVCQPQSSDSNVSLYNEVSPTEDLYRLALVSGGLSRFKFDERLPQGSFEKMYNIWIERACPKIGTNKQIMVYRDNNNTIRGMITIDDDGVLGHISLVAVDPEMQHKGIGTKIMSSLDNYLYNRGVKEVEVPTQHVNTEACRWYEKNGFKIKTVTNIYHWWLKK